MARKPSRSQPTEAVHAIDTAERDRYRAEDALRTLKRAEEIRGDRELMRDVKSYAKQEIKNVARVLGKPKPGAR